MDKLFKIMTFFRLIDPVDNNLSITNIAMIVSLIRLGTTPQASYQDIGALMLTLSSYSYKKYLHKDNQQPQTKGDNANV